MTEPLLSVRNLKKYFPVKAGMFGSEDRVVKAVDDVTFDIAPQETFALVGESGCGKSTLGRTILRLVEPTAGSVVLGGVDLGSLKPEALRRMRTRMQIVFQDPYASLDPRMRIGDIIAEPLLTHGKGNREEREARVLELMRVVGLRADCIRRYPHEFSGGQRQRIGIARALALNPEFIVCDEPLSALDVSIQAQVLNLLADLQAAFRLTYLFITHDLSVVRHFAPRVGVMFLGKMVEMGPTEQIFVSPKHPYTRFLVSAVPVPDPRQRGRKKELLEGEIPSPVNLPSGCRFRTRCPYAAPVCAEVDPPSVFEGGRSWACHFPLS
ncbi:MAG: ATP-binding cassette domain-containing protein [Synergistaceae bacterium]|jgi:oligopeptide/dipeptide ABC transporter ATP-binding protein|nr:ATP-binding cassette domain-containing protein [Synergistaceae bacterium]